MAKIKTKKYTFEEKEIAINFNCSQSGEFSVNLKPTMVDKLGLDVQLKGLSLQELEKTIDDAFQDYKKANTTYTLKIGVSFGICGEFLRDELGEFIPEALGYNNPLHITSFGIGNSHLSSLIGLDFHVVIIQNIDGREFKYEAVPVDKFDKVPDHKIVYNGYVANELIHFSSSDKEKLIDYSELALSNLLSIRSQLQRASKFLATLVSSDKLEIMLNSSDIKMLTNTH